jgi:uncharacterized protein YkwD
MSRRALLALCCLAAALGLTACGGGEKKPAAPPPSGPQAGPGGTINAAPTIGRLGPAETVVPGRVKVIGRQGPISPKANVPTGAQRKGVAGGVACASAAAAPSARNLSRMASAIVCLLNGERAAKGLAPLKSNGKLANASRLMAGLMVKRRFFAHDTPDGRSLSDRVRPTGYMRGSWQLGENLAWGSGGLATPRAIVNGWMHSPGHRANILHASFRDVGLGIRMGPPLPSVSGGATYVADFGKHG